MTTSNNTPKTLVEAMALIAKMETELAAKNNGPVRTIKVECAKYGAGTISLYGLGRNQVSLYPSQWPIMAEQLGCPAGMFDQSVIGKAIKALVNKTRCSAVAFDYALKALGLKARPAKTDPSNASWEREWDKGYAIALAAPEIVSDRSK